MHACHIIQFKRRIFRTHTPRKRNAAARGEQIQWSIHPHRGAFLHTIHQNDGKWRRLLLVCLPQRCGNLRKQSGNPAALLSKPCKDGQILLVLCQKHAFMPIFFDQAAPLHTTAHDDICLCALLPFMAAVETERTRKDDRIAALHELQPHDAVRDGQIATCLRLPIVMSEITPAK